MEKFISHPLLGDLWVEKVLIEYDYPRVFVCIDAYDQRFLWCEYVSEQNLDKWIVQKISKSRYDAILYNEITLQDCYYKPEGRGLFIVSKNYSINAWSVTETSKVPQNSLVIDPVYIGEEKPYTYYKDKWFNQLQIEASETLLDSYDVHDDYLMDLFNEVYRRGYYREFAHTIIQSRQDNCIRALLYYYSSLDKSQLSSDDYQLVYDCLKNNENISVKSGALNTILSWDYFPDLKKLKEVVIPNRFFQEHLLIFIKEHETLDK